MTGWRTIQNKTACFIRSKLADQFIPVRQCGHLLHRQSTAEQTSDDEVYAAKAHLALFQHVVPQLVDLVEDVENRSHRHLPAGVARILVGEILPVDLEAIAQPGILREPIVAPALFRI